MLTVIREIAEAAEARRDDPPAELLRALLERGDAAVARTPEQLDVLREAGVVDAGGAGLLELLRGVVAAVTGEQPPEAPAVEAEEAGLDAIHQELSRYRYCTAFVVEGDGLDPDALERELEPLGDSLLVVGDRERAQGARPHRRPGRRAPARHRARGDRRDRDREHAPPDRRREQRLLRAVPDAPPPPPTSSRSSPATGTGALFESLGARDRRPAASR